jgi:hypothetical protein
MLQHLGDSEGDRRGAGFAGCVCRLGSLARDLPPFTCPETSYHPKDEYLLPPRQCCTRLIAVYPSVPRWRIGQVAHLRMAGRHIPCPPRSCAHLGAPRGHLTDPYRPMCQLLFM